MPVSDSTRQVASVRHATYLFSVRIWLLLPALLCSTPLFAQADGTIRSDRRKPRRVVLAVVGALAGGAAGNFVQRQGETRCRSCYVGGGAIIGSAVGWIVGRELDESYALRYRGAARLRIPYLEQTLDGDPVALAARDSLVAVATSAGVTILSSTASLRQQGRRASGIRGIAALDLTSRTHAMAVATPTGLFLFPPSRGPGALVREGTIQAVSAAEDVVFFAIGPRVEWAPLDADSASRWPGLELHAPPVDLEWDSSRQVLWALTDTLLVALQWGGDGLRIASTTRVDGGGRSLATRGDRLGIAHGSGGVSLLDVSNTGSPRITSTWRGARFVYDVALTDNRLFAGAGPEGVFVIDVSVLPVRTIGLAFDLGFAADLLSRDDYTYILDRRTSSLRRISTPTTR